MVNFIVKITFLVISTLVIVRKKYVIAAISNSTNFKHK